MTPFLIIFAFFFEFLFAMLSLGFCLHTCTTSLRLAYALSFSMVLLSLMVEMAFNNVLILYYAFSLDSVSQWIKVTRYLF